MARIQLLCPIDGLNLGAANTNLPISIPNLTADQGSHLHLETSFQFTCSNGHTWQATVDIQLNRIS